MNDLERKVTNVMEAIGFSLDDFDLVVDAFQLGGVDGVITVIEDTVFMAFEHMGELLHLGNEGDSSHDVPGVEGIGSFFTAPTAPDGLEIVLEYHHRRDGSIEIQDVGKALQAAGSDDRASQAPHSVMLDQACSEARKCAHSTGQETAQSRGGPLLQLTVLAVPRTIECGMR